MFQKSLKKWLSLFKKNWPKTKSPGIHLNIFKCTPGLLSWQVKIYFGIIFSKFFHTTEPDFFVKREKEIIQSYATYYSKHLCKCCWNNNYKFLKNLWKNNYLFLKKCCQKKKSRDTLAYFQVCMYVLIYFKLFIYIVGHNKLQHTNSVQLTYKIF